MLLNYTCIFTKSAQMGENIKMSYTGNQAVISSLKNEAASNMEKNCFGMIHSGMHIFKKISFLVYICGNCFPYEFTQLKLWGV